MKALKIAGFYGVVLAGAGFASYVGVHYAIKTVIGRVI